MLGNFDFKPKLKERKKERQKAINYYNWSGRKILSNPAIANRRPLGLAWPTDCFYF